MLLLDLKNGNADALSRWLLKPSEEDENIIEIEEGEKAIEPGMAINNVVLQEVELLISGEKPKCSMKND
ncbi:hypothetical protein BpHYR1_053958 [Brachionus plicatilis]|uniref:Uncharacterized protein n=1 Tax=Brachionus plicatilis TaxID=10195 RepID=A0A3M7PQA2_BRAPC|nr:hypothetical protein BpHYR1_053958 [Brachionus plicatilis]